MSRRRRAEPRIIAPDNRYSSIELARFINRLMLSGKKTTAQRVVYTALDLIREESHRDPMEVFELALKKHFGAKYCSVVSNGTAALHLAGLALGWKKRDVV